MYTTKVSSYSQCPQFFDVMGFYVQYSVQFNVIRLIHDYTVITQNN